jgi:large subunit ribosomal protein L25
VAEVRIPTEPRTEFGKGAARRLRRNAQVPGVLYGHGTEPVHVALPAHELGRALKTSGVLLELELESGRQLALPKSVQRDPIKHTIEHIDLVVIVRGEVVTVEVPVVTEGKIAPGGLIEHVNKSIAVNADATRIPAQLTVSVEGLTIGDSVHARDVTLPEGVTLSSEPDFVLIHVLGAQMAPEEEPAEAPVAEAVVEAATEE